MRRKYGKINHIVNNGEWFSEFRGKDTDKVMLRSWLHFRQDASHYT